MPRAFPAPAPLPLHTAITGVPVPARSALLARLLARRDAPVALVITDTDETAERLASELPWFLPEAGTEVIWLRESGRPEGRMTEFAEAGAERLHALGSLRAAARGGPPHRAICIGSVAALAEPLPAPGDFEASQIHVRLNAALAPGALCEKLHAFDYDSEAVVERPGQFARRGGLIDVYPVTSATPYRIDFFGDTIEDIREFDPVTQRSGTRCKEVFITCAPTVTFQAARDGIAGYLGTRADFIVIEPVAVEETLSLLVRDRLSPESDWLRASLRDARAACDDTWSTIGEFEAASAFVDAPAFAELGAAEALTLLRPGLGASELAEGYWDRERAARTAFLRSLAAGAAAGDRIVFVLPNEGEIARARELLAEEGDGRWAEAEIVEGPLREGFRLEDPGRGPAVVYVTEAEFFGRRPRARRATRQRSRRVESQVDRMLDFSELAEGDYVVHLQHGIAIFRGFTHVESQGERREAVTLEFADNVVVHVPVHDAHLVTRYVGLTKAIPPLGKLGSDRWEKTRASAERSALEFAAQLLATQATREARGGFAFPPDNAWQHEFEAAFPYTETPDQLRAIRETKADMEKARAMDRLVCGDVGFGKTEVAMRAAFKAVTGGRQVAVLVPTTVLAQQHLNNFRERLAGFPVRVDMLSRFRTPAEQKRIAAAAAEGRIDILIGTHRLLGADVAFRNLGLVIIDEEQRFGVRHKEALKRLRETVDVLTLSATPIPRTLYLALAGARDLSVIETPPAERHPIRTVVKMFDWALVEQAIRFEIRRGGQVFYLHNRIETIDRVAAQIRERMPDVSVAVGHGKMNDHELERVMTDFVAGRFHVLVCTTIIESGIDIPRCNTILIEGADRFGLSQLYQIRGRVGRFRQQAYAYLLLHRHARLLDAARQRLQAMRQYNQLGAGFRIAMRDLELRGAGDLLGAKQSGHVAGVGFDLYCQLLRQSVARLKSERRVTWVRCTLKLDFLRLGTTAGGGQGGSSGSHGYTALRLAESADGSIPAEDARIPADYIAETRLRLDVYRRLALADDLREVRELESELKDRFGPLPAPARLLLEAARVRCRAEQKGVQRVETDGSRLRCLRASGRPDDYVMIGSRFPRLAGLDAASRLREVDAFLNNLPDA